MQFLLPVASVLYLIGIALTWRRLNKPSAGTDHYQFGSIGLAAIAALGHALLLMGSALPGEGINLALGHVASLVALVSVVVYVLASLAGPVVNLGVLVLPIGLAGLWVGYLIPGPDLMLVDPPISLLTHLSIALLAIAVLCIATAQAALLYVQESKLHSRNPGNLLPSLPPLQTMETILQSLIQLGVVLLTVNLITGMFSNLQLRDTLLEFNHHTLLSVIAWISYSALLIGHKIVGWRGKIAARWTLLAFVVLVLSYFGARFVSSIILA